MKTTVKKISAEIKNATINSTVKVNKKLDHLKTIESKKQEEINKLTFDLNL